VIVLDTSVIYALLDAADARHREAVGWYETVDDDLVTTPLVLAEADFLAASRGGPAALRAFRGDLAGGAYIVEWWPGAAAEAAAVADGYADLGIGLTDASLVALASRVGTLEVATFDQRHFRAVRPLTGGDAFRLLPLDAMA
jgi:predicted nucleic acid-binding protein